MSSRSIGYAWFWLGLVLVGCATQPPPRPPRVAGDDALPGAELAAAGLKLAARGDDFSAEQYLVAAVSAGYPEAPLTRIMVKSCIAGGRLERALSHAQSYVERHPEDWIFHHVLASIHFAKGDGPLAQQALELVLSEHPDHAESHYLMGLILRDQLGALQRARDEFEQYLALSPSGAHHQETRAWLRRAQAFPVAVSRAGEP